MGPLAVHPQNPRYFQNTATKEVVYLTGSHTWANLVDIGPSDPPPQFDFDKYIDWMAKLNHNFMRMWTWELVTWDTKANGEGKHHTAAPQPYARTGPGNALDGKPKFDLTEIRSGVLRAACQTCGGRPRARHLCLRDALRRLGPAILARRLGGTSLQSQEQHQRHRRGHQSRRQGRRDSRAGQPDCHGHPASVRAQGRSIRSTASTTSCTKSPTRITRPRPSGSTT